MDTFRLTMAQLNPTVGALAQNADKAREAWAAGKAAGAHLVALPEMFLSGYQVQDMVQKPAFLADCARHLAQLAADCADGPALAPGFGNIRTHRPGGPPNLVRESVGFLSRPATR
jgi:NAD+ synthase